MFVRILAWLVVSAWQSTIIIRTTWFLTKKSAHRFWFLTRSLTKMRDYVLAPLIRTLTWLMVRIWRSAIIVCTACFLTSNLPRMLDQARIGFDGEWWKLLNDQLSTSIPFMTLIATIAAVISAIATLRKDRHK
jgi:hypothetical protein